MFEVTARMRIRDGGLDGFKQHAAQIMSLAREHDTQTIRYDWYVSADGTACEVREQYIDPDGLIEHNTNVREARDALFRECAYGHDMTIYNEPSPALAALMERMAGHVVFNRLSLLQGLNGSPDEAAAGFEATARLNIREGRLDDFTRHAAEVMRQMREQDEQPRRYDWFLSDDGRVCEVLEAYDSPDALLAHQQRVAPAKTTLFRETLDGHTMTFYGEPSPVLAAALQAMGTPHQRYAFFQGLSADAEVLNALST